MDSCGFMWGAHCQYPASITRQSCIKYEYPTKRQHLKYGFDYMHVIFPLLQSINQKKISQIAISLGLYVVRSMIVVVVSLQGNPGPPGPNGSKGRAGPRGVKVGVREQMLGGWL